jgi:hypothetical protein
VIKGCGKEGLQEEGILMSNAVDVLVQTFTRLINAGIFSPDDEHPIGVLIDIFL